MYGRVANEAHAEPDVKVSVKPPDLRSKDYEIGTSMHRKKLLLNPIRRKSVVSSSAYGYIVRAVLLDRHWECAAGKHDVVMKSSHSDCGLRR